jgi:hypothetical protein
MTLGLTGACKVGHEFAAAVDLDGFDRKGMSVNEPIEEGSGDVRAMRGSPFSTTLFDGQAIFRFS